MIAEVATDGELGVGGREKTSDNEVDTSARQRRPEL
jgi:hypothetical protein